MKNFDLSFLELESFVAVCTYQNFTKAAEKLYISQPTLSRRIKAVEEELGVSLFHRNGTYIELNDAGRFLYKEAEKILQQRDNIYASMSRFSDNVAGTLRIAVEHSFPLPMVMYGIEKMSGQYPDVAINVECSHETNVPKFLQKQTVDIGFTFKVFVEDLPDLHHHVLGYNRATFLVGKNHRLSGKRAITWKDLDGEVLYVSSNPAKFASEGQKQGSVFSNVIITSTFEEAAMYAATGKGVAIGGVDSAQTFSESHQIQAIPMVDEYSLGYPVLVWAESNDNPLIQNFCKFYEQFDVQSKRDVFQ